LLLAPKSVEWTSCCLAPRKPIRGPTLSTERPVNAGIRQCRRSVSKKKR
jgi:hypothetical protein